MFNIATNTTESMTKTFPQETALAASLGSFERIDVINANPISLCSIDTCLSHLTEKPQIEFSTSSDPELVFLGLRLEAQVLEDEYRIWRNPLTQLSCGFFTERHISVSMLPTQPFKHLTHASRVMVLCLMVVQLLLKALANFTKSFVGLFEFGTRDEQRLGFRGSNDGVVDTQVNPNWRNSLWFWNFNRQTQSDFIGSSNHYGVFGDSLLKVILGVIRNNKVKLLAASGCRDGKLSLSCKTEVLIEQKQSSLPLKGKHLGCWSLVFLGRRISSRYVSDC